MGASHPTLLVPRIKCDTCSASNSADVAMKIVLAQVFLKWPCVCVKKGKQDWLPLHMFKCTFTNIGIGLAGLPCTIIIWQICFIVLFWVWHILQGCCQNNKLWLSPQEVWVTQQGPNMGPPEVHFIAQLVDEYHVVWGSPSTLDWIPQGSPLFYFNCCFSAFYFFVIVVLKKQNFCTTLVRP